MKTIAKSILAAAMLVGTTFAMTAPASAYVGIEFGFGGPGYAFGDPCDYYDYYNEPPPWGLPSDYCDYPVYFEPVYFGGTWYRGPIYYRWTHGRRLFWLHGGWREDAWRGPRPAGISWQRRGGPNHGFRPGVNIRGGIGSRPWIGGVPDRPADRSNAWHSGHGQSGGIHFGGGNPWNGGANFGGGVGGGHFGGGNGGSHFGGGSHGGFGGHGPH